MLYETAAHASEVLALNIEDPAWTPAAPRSAPRAATPNGSAGAPAPRTCCPASSAAARPDRCSCPSAAPAPPAAPQPGTCARSPDGPGSATTVPGIPEELVTSMLDGDEGSARWGVEDVDATIAYAASKLALARAMRRRAPAWASDGVRLNAIAPGAVDTPLLQATLADSELGPLVRAFPIPCGRFGRATEIADGILFLLGPAASFCCGSVLFVDGGTDALVRPDGL